MPNLTALENVELAAQISDDPLNIKEVMEAVELGKRLDNFPAQLSGGEQQRVAIARAVAKNPLLQAESQSVFSIGIMILASGLLAFAVIYNITTINIFERRRELATLKVLGFTNSEMRQLVFNENLIITLLATGCGLPAGQYLLNLLCQEAANENMNFPAVLNQPSYLLAVLLVLFCSISANLILMKVYAINMVEALKSSE